MKISLVSILLLFSFSSFSQGGNASANDTTVFTIVEQSPSFPGGTDAMLTFIKNEIKYPEAEKKANVTGTCYVTFIVEKDGRLSDVKLLRGISGSPAFDVEAIRVVNQMPNWIPGKHNGNLVRVQNNIPVKFFISMDEQKPDTTYYSEEGKEIEKEKADFYRLIYKQQNGFLIKEWRMKTNVPKSTIEYSSVATPTKDGKAIYFSSDGKIERTGNYENNKRVGTWTQWSNEALDSLVIECFSDGTYINKFVPQWQKYNTEYNVKYIAEVMPSFPGGEAEMMNFIIQNVVYPKEELKAGISGTCYVTFVVEKNGSITDVRVLRGVRGGPGCDKEAIRVVSIMPAWSPGTQLGKPVRVQYNLPIKFILRNKK